MITEENGNGERCETRAGRYRCAIIASDRMYRVFQKHVTKLWNLTLPLAKWKIYNNTINSHKLQKKLCFFKLTTLLLQG